MFRINTGDSTGEPRDQTLTKNGDKCLHVPEHLPLISESFNYTCAQTCRGQVCTALSEYDVLGGPGEFLLASGPLLVASNQLWPLSAPRSLPVVTNIHAALLPLLKLHFQSLLWSLPWLFNLDDGRLSPHHGQIWGPMCFSLVHLPTPTCLAPAFPPRRVFLSTSFAT